MLGSPQIIRGESYSSKSDIWSLGIILYEMVYQRMPFVSNQVDILKMFADLSQQQERFTYKKQMALPTTPEISPIIKEVLQALLQFREEDRPNIQEVLQMNIFKKKFINPLNLTDAITTPEEKTEQGQQCNSEEQKKSLNQDLIQKVIGYTEILVDNEITVNRQENNYIPLNQANVDAQGLQSANEVLRNLSNKEQADYQNLRLQTLDQQLEEKYIYELEKMIYFHRNKAMLIHLIMSNFIVNQKCFDFIPYVQCILIDLYLFYYYYYSVAAVNFIFNSQNTQNSKLFISYKKSTFYSQTQEKLNLDLKNAEKLSQQIESNLKEQLLSSVQQLKQNQSFDQNNEYLFKKFCQLQQAQCTDIAAYQQCLQEIITNLNQRVNLEQLQQKNVLKVWHSLLIATKIDHYIDEKKFINFDQQKFIEEFILKQSPQQIKDTIKNWDNY